MISWFVLAFLNDPVNILAGAGFRNAGINGDFETGIGADL